MGIPSITQPGPKPPAPAAAPDVAAPAASSLGAAPVMEEAEAQAMHPVPEPPAPAPPPPPPPPREAFPFEVAVSEHPVVPRKVYGFVDEETGQTVVQIPVDAVLNLVADIIQQLEAEGMR